jgi:hypothetical protein
MGTCTKAINIALRAGCHEKHGSIHSTLDTYVSQGETTIELKQQIITRQCRISFMCFANRLSDTIAHVAQLVLTMSDVPRISRRNGKPKIRVQQVRTEEVIQ